MSRPGRSAALWLALLLGACAPMPYGPLDGRSYSNPVLARDFPDPAVLRAPDGWYYAYATQSASQGKFWNLQVARSPDLVRWLHLGDALPGKPAWAAGKQSFWAPHVVHDPALNRYFMYYSAEPDRSSGKCLAVATSEAPAGPFVDSGAPLICGAHIEHIDPMAFDDPRTGRRLLYWGSGSQPIRVQELAADRITFRAGSAPKEVLHPDAGKPYSALIEAPWVIFRDGTYFLFYSGDRCCVAPPRYAVMVARSGDAFGPFEPLASQPPLQGSAILEAGGRWRAPGHNAVVADESGRDWMLYHAFDAENAASGRVMLLEPLVYRDGWPRIETAAARAKRDKLGQ